MVDSEYFIVLVAMVSHPEVDGGAISSSCMHHLSHHPGYIQYFLPLDITSRLLLSYTSPWLLLSVVVAISATVLLKVFRHSILLLELIPDTL